jgi:hypothetical protein
MPIYSVLCIEGNPNRVLIGTELGIWGSENVGTPFWQECNITGSDPTKWHPRAATYEIIEVGSYSSPDGSGYSGPVVYSGTHGRGTFRSTTLSTYWPTNVQFANKYTEAISVYPNPATNLATINYNTSISGKASIRIYSLTGTLVKSFESNVQNGANSIQLDLTGIATGGYIVYLSNGEKHASAKLIKQ